MKKILIASIVLSIITLQGCGLQKLIEQAINKLRAVEVVTGTVLLANATDHSGTKIEINGKTTHTNVNGEFRILVSGSPAQSISAQSVNELTISHTGFVTENIPVPAETENGEYGVYQKELKHRMTTVTINVVCDQDASYTMKNTNPSGDIIGWRIGDSGGTVPIFKDEYIIINYKKSLPIEITTSDNVQYVFVFPIETTYKFETPYKLYMDQQSSNYSMLGYSDSDGEKGYSLGKFKHEIRNIVFISPIPKTIKVWFVERN